MTAIITQTNVTEFVQMYFEICKAPNITTFKEKCQKMHEMQGASKLKMSDIYNIFWAIRILAETGKYDHDDIEFHVKKNPIFAEIPTTDYDGDLNDEKKSDEKPKQVGLLRKAIREYKEILAGQIKMGSLVGIGAKL